MAFDSNEKPFSKPQVFVDGVESTSVFVVAIEDNFGVLPSKCILRYGADNQDTTGPTTLLANDFGTANGQRIEIVNGSADRVFLGSLLRRHDQGSANNLLWTALDDKVFLQQIPVRGALVDNGDGSVKMIRRFDARMNPDGFWNCIGALSPLDGTTVVPVFTSKAVLGLKYTSPDFTIAVPLAVGTIVPWTPRLALEYLWLISQLASGDVDGLDDNWRSIITSDRIYWELGSITALVGTDIALGQDPLDRKLPDTQLRGQKLLGAISTVLQAAGTHDIQLLYQDDGRSLVQFQPISFSAFSAPGGNTPNVNLVRGGDLQTTDTLFDFDLLDDASTVCEAVLVEGGVVHLETSITNSAGEPFGSANCLNPAWTDDEEAGFLLGINGGLGTVNPNQPYAKYPANQGDNWASGGWLTADGGSGRPTAFRCTPDATALLHSYFPYVYRAFYVDSDALQTSGVTAGALSQYEDTTVYPVLSYQRPILPAQLQFNLNNPTGGTNILNWLRDTFPLRIRVLNSTWFDIPLVVRVRTSGNGLIWLDGLATEVNGKPECLYAGDLSIEPCGSNVNSTTGALVSSRLKDLVINCVVPLDHRVQGTAVIASPSVLTDSYRNQCGGPPLAYVDSPDAYQECDQVNSMPSAAVQFFGGTSPGDQVSSPLTRILPPGSEQPYANYAAERVLYRSRLPSRDGMFRLIGIRDDFRAGMFLTQIITINAANPADTNYTINAPIMSILHQYTRPQQSIIGGIASAANAVGRPRGGPINV